MLSSSVQVEPLHIYHLLLAPERAAGPAGHQAGSLTDPHLGVPRGSFVARPCAVSAAPAARLPSGAILHTDTRSVVTWPRWLSEDAQRTNQIWVTWGGRVRSGGVGSLLVRHRRGPRPSRSPRPPLGRGREPPSHQSQPAGPVRPDSRLNTDAVSGRLSGPNLSDFICDTQVTRTRPASP